MENVFDFFDSNTNEEIFLNIEDNREIFIHISQNENEEVFQTSIYDTVWKKM